MRDRTRPEWDSKTAMVALYCAAALPGTCYWEPGLSGRGAMQCADGKVLVPPVSPVTLAIVHDGMDYPEARGILRVIRLDGGPGRRSLASFPLSPRDRLKQPRSNRFDAAVGGARPGDSWEDAVDALGPCRVAVAIPGDPVRAGEICGHLKGRGCEVTKFTTPDIPLASALYRTCPTVVHLGDCRRGYLHSLAMLHADRLVEGHPGERFTPATLEDFKSFLL